MTHSHIRYRGHIDGLRAIAVMGVVLFHFGATWLPGGFLGVDVFFVISGFLISRSLYNEIDGGKFSLMDFYERRARRIVPALVTVIAATAVAGYFLLFPKLYEGFAKSALAALTFTSNIYFWIKADYFAPDATQIPLLHLWSLGVEEQFYILFPFLAIAIAKLPRRFALPVLVVLAAASLTASQVMLSFSPQASFYLLPFRAFELLFGSILARKEMYFPAGRIAHAAIISGTVGILAAMLLINEHMAFPGMLALVPCFFAASVIWGAERQQTWLSDTLGKGPFRFLGAISYSLYLVHWPIVVFVQPLLSPLVGSEGFLIIATAVSVMLAWISFRIIEQPFRQKRAVWTRSRIFSATAAASFCLMSMSALIINSKGMPSRVSGEAAAILERGQFAYGPAWRLGKCFLGEDDKIEVFDRDTCLSIAGEKSIVLWGDSTMAHFYPGLHASLRDKPFQIGQATLSGCPPIVGFTVADRPVCKPFNDMVLTSLVETKPLLVVMAARWDMHRDFAQALLFTIKQLREANIQVVVLGQGPLFKRPVPEVLAARIMVGNHSLMSGGDLDYDELAAIDERLKSVVAQRSDVRFISILQTVCRDSSCPMVRNGQPLLYDRVHLTDAGSKAFADALITAYRDR